VFLLGQEVDGLAYVFARAICLISHFPHGLGIVRLVLAGTHYCSGANDSYLLLRKDRQGFCCRALLFLFCRTLR